MRIKLAILESDANYLQRITSVFGTKYSDKLEIYSFTDLNVAVNTIESSKIDVFIANDSFEINVDSLPKRCGFAYFVDSPDIDSKNGATAICKFQKADLIYKQILSIYSETAGSISGLKLNDDSAKVIAFQPVGGGCGSSCCAASCAVHFAKKGYKVLYLNLEKFGSSDLYFKAEGQFDMSDMIFALKSKKSNLSLKLESCVKCDESGVCFYSQPKIALDVMELNADDINRLISELMISGAYNYIILDLDFSINENALKVLRKVHSIVWVGDGSETSNVKLFRAFAALSTMEQNADSPLPSRLSLIYNKFSNKTSKTLDELGIKVIGGAPRYEHATSEQVIGCLSKMEMFDKIV